MHQKVLVVVDMQNDFISGSLGTKEAQAVVKSVKKKVDEAVKEKREVVYTRDTHGANYLDTQEGKKLPVSACRRRSIRQRRILFILQERSSSV